MGVSVSEDEYRVLREALATIARGWKPSITGKTTNIYRHEMITQAREACHAAGIKWHEPRQPSKGETVNAAAS
jgi:hypothetical protein